MTAKTRQSLEDKIEYLAQKQVLYFCFEWEIQWKNKFILKVMDWLKKKATSFYYSISVWKNIANLYSDVKKNEETDNW